MRPGISTCGLAALSAHLQSRPTAISGAIRAEQDPKKMLGELISSFEVFKANAWERLGKVESSVGNFQASLDDMTVRTAAIGLGGGIMPNAGVQAPDPDYTRTFKAYTRAGLREHELQEVNGQGERQRINAAMSSSSSSETGGYLVPSEWDRQVRKAQRAVSPSARSRMWLRPLSVRTLPSGIRASGARGGQAKPRLVPRRVRRRSSPSTSRMARFMRSQWCRNS